MSRLDDLCRAYHGAGNEHGFGRCHGIQNGALLAAIGISDYHLHHEPIDLRLGERIRALLLQGILGGKHQERCGQTISLISDRYLALLHRFQQSALYFCRCAIDFVREDEIAENRPVLRPERSVLRVVDHRSHDVGRQHIGGELQPLEIQGNATGQGLQCERLGQAGDALQQNMPVGEQGDQQSVEQVFLTHNDARHLLLQRTDPG